MAGGEELVFLQGSVHLAFFHPVDYKGRTDLHASAAAHSEVENCG